MCSSTTTTPDDSILVLFHHCVSYSDVCVTFKPLQEVDILLSLSLPHFQDNLKETRVMKREKIELLTVKGITQVTRHPKQPHSFALKFKGAKKIVLNCDSE